MNPIRYTLKELKEKTVPIGREGENEYTVVSIDCAEVYEEYPAAVASMKVQNPNKVIYPVVIERSGNDIIWTVKASDLTVKGDGRFQLTFTEGTVIHKTVIGRTLILKSLVGDGPVPEAVEDWIDEATELMEDMEEKRDSGYFKGDPGEPGEPGAPGHSPVLTADKVGKTTTIYSDGTQLAQILDGQDGQAGAIIDDTAPAADKVFSSSKVNGELNTVKSALTAKPEIKNSTKTGVDLDISDENGNVLARMKDGEIETEKFNSAESPAMKNSTKTGVDFDFADPNGNVLVRFIDGHIKTEKFDSKENSIRICYVSPSGSDSNDGSKDHPFGTFQHAIDEGYKKIIAEVGEYKNQQIVMNGLDGISIISNGNTTEANIFESHARRKRAKIDNSIDIGELTQDGTIYKAPLTVPNDSSYYKVFISEELDPVYSGSAYYGRITTYNAILWEITDSILSCTRLVPKLTKVECEATQGSFFFDGDYIYINPTGGDLTGKSYKRLNLDTNQYGVDIRNCTNIHIQGIDIAFFPYYDLYFGHCEDVTVKDCCFTFTCYGNTVEFNGADATVISCLAAQAGADGFGIAGYGDCSFYDCSAIRCYDDGISHHDGSTGVIDGGLWMNCLKGGVTPSYGSNVSVKNVVCKGNVYGIYYPQSGDRVTDAVLMMQNCLAIGNTTKDIKISGYDVLSHGCAYGTKEVDTGSTLTEYGNTVIS